MFPKFVAVEICGEEAVIIEVKNDSFPVGGRCRSGDATGDVVKLRNFWNLTLPLPDQLSSASVEAEHFHRGVNVAGDKEFVAPYDR